MVFRSRLLCGACSRCVRVHGGLNEAGPIYLVSLTAVTIHRLGGSKGLSGLSRSRRVGTYAIGVSIRISNRVRG